MSEPPLPKTDTPIDVRKSAAHGRLYVFSVVALALFVIMVVVWRQPPTSFTARVVIEQTGRHSQLDDQASIAAAIQQAHQNHASAGHDKHGHSHADQATTNGDQPHLLVDVQPSASGKVIAVWCAAKTAAAAEREANLLAENYLQQFATTKHLPSESAACHAAKAATLAALKAKNLAQADLDSFLVRHGDALVSDRRSEKQSAAPVVKPRANPAWTDLDDRLQVLRAARDELLVNKTEAHPQVRDLQWQVEKLEAELALVSPTLVDATANNRPQQPAPTSVAPPHLLKQLAKLQAAVAAAGRQFDNALAAENNAQQPAKSSADTNAKIAQPAAIVATRGAGASRSAVFGGGIFALFVGVVIAWKSRKLLQPTVLLSTMQIESLGVGVIATLATHDGPPLPLPHISTPRWIAWLTFVCEWAVAAIAVTMLLLMLADWQLAGQMLNDPLSTYGEAVNRLW